MKLILLILFPCFLFAQKNPAEWNFKKKDTVPGIVISIRNNKTFTDYRVPAQAVYNIFERGITGMWTDNENGEVVFYNGLQSDKQLIKILIQSTAFSPSLVKELDLRKYYRFIPLSELIE